ncbi:MAG TPA: TetR family transcriptional regulator, partial [Acidimicrobiales bacterium]|nr:TetR family transcriptional regulator [Acidimicrobiales bacterium]
MGVEIAGGSPAAGQGGAPPGLRERKKARTRQQLEEAAFALFAERGFDATTVEDITAAVEVSPRTFFRYFTTKEEVLLAYDRELRDQVVAALEARPADEPVLLAVHRAVMAVAGIYEARKDRLFRTYQLMVESPTLAAHSQQLQTAWVQPVAEEVARRLDQDPATDLLPRLVARVALSCLQAAADTWFTTDGRVELPELVDRAFTVVVD